MSNGSSTLTVRDPATFEPLDEIEVTRDGAPVDNLNELECVDGLVFANVWLTDEIVVIGPDGAAVAVSTPPPSTRSWPMCPAAMS